MATVEQRQAACTHLNVTRLFDEFDCQKCQICGRISSFGWLYRCTQDFESFLPESDFSTTNVENLDTRLSEQIATTQLSQAVLRGIQDGHYSTQQIRLLHAQKLRVKEAIAMQEDALEEQSQSHLTSNSRSSSRATVDDSILTANGTPEALEPQSQKTLCQAAKSKNPDQNEPHSVIPRASNLTNIEPFVPNCDFRCCQTCRPAYRDRAFQSLNAVLTEPFKQPPLWEIENRRISDAYLLKNIAISPSQPQPPCRSSQTFDDVLALDGYRICGNSDYEDIASQIQHKRRRNAGRWSGFRRAIKKKALGSVNQPDRFPSSSRQSKSSRSLNRKTFSPRSRGTIFFNQHTSQAEKENQIVSNRALQESLALMLAVNTPLPRAREDSASLEREAGRGEGEVGVEDGVAVTEEGVEMSAADIIIMET